jgi:hypothetical protein
LDCPTGQYQDKSKHCGKTCSQKTNSCGEGYALDNAGTNRKIDDWACVTTTTTTTITTTTTTVRICTSGEYRDALTNECIHCPASTFRAQISHGFSQCSPHVLCEDDEFVVAVANATTNYVCSTDSECGVDQV